MEAGGIESATSKSGADRICSMRGSAACLKVHVAGDCFAEDDRLDVDGEGKKAFGMTRRGLSFLSFTRCPRAFGFSATDRG